MGRAFQEFDGLDVTDAVVPPQGVQLRPGRVKWEAIKEVEFLDWNVKNGMKYFTKARLTTTDNSAREVFLWNPGGRDEYSQLYRSDVQIVGKLSIAGKEQDVLMKGTTTGLRRLVITKGA